MNPVTKVVRLLEDMQSTLTKEKEQDEEAYEKMSCWCTTNKGDKEAAVKIAEAQIGKLTSDIEKFTAKSAQLKASIAKLKKETAANEKALDEATALRGKENGEFGAQENDLLESISGVSKAIDVLQKHQSFLQMTTDVRSEVYAPINRVLQTSSILPSQRRALEELLQAPGQETGFKSYNSRSGGIFGTLSAMKESFETDLAGATKEEKTAQSEYDELKAAKTEEMTAARKLTNEQTTEMSETDIALADAKHSLTDTRKKQSADSQFLQDLSERCSNSDAEYAQRTKDRANEMAGVSETIGILTDDSARDLFSSQLSFVQRGESSRRLRAATLLQKAARRSKNMALLKVAGTVQLDAFVKVTAAIDDMVAALKKEMADEVEHQRFCTSELQKNAKSQDNKQDHAADLDSSIAEGVDTMETLDTDIKNLKADINEMNVQLKAASEQREVDNKDFQQTVADQRATQTLLTKALARLEEVYAAKDTGAAFVQVKQTPGAAAPPPPPAFKTYKKSSGSGGVMAMLQKIISEAESLEAEAMKDEQVSQKAYEQFVANTKESTTASQRSITDKTEQRAQREERLLAEKKDLAATKTTIEELKKYNSELHTSCDFVLENFDTRQTARAEEIDSLGQAKAILHGAKY